MTCRNKLRGYLESKINSSHGLSYSVCVYMCVCVEWMSMHLYVSISDEVLLFRRVPVVARW